MSEPCVGQPNIESEKKPLIVILRLHIFILVLGIETPIEYLIITYYFLLYTLCVVRSFQAPGMEQFECGTCGNANVYLS